MGFHIQICSILRFLLVDFTKVLCSSANELQQSSNASREEYAPPILTVLLEIHRVYIWPSWPFVFCLSFVNNFTSSVWNFCRWVAEIIPCETSSAAKSEEKRLFSQAMSSLNWFFWWVQICLSSCLQGLFSFFLGIATNLDNKNNNSSRTFPTFVRWPLNNLLSPCTSYLLQLFGAGENIFYSCLTQCIIILPLYIQVMNVIQTTSKCTAECNLDWIITFQCKTLSSSRMCRVLNYMIFLCIQMILESTKFFPDSSNEI